MMSTEKEYYTARVTKSYMMALGEAQHRDGFKHRWKHFIMMTLFYLKVHHPDIAHRMSSDANR
jgi:hypothetical protein